jgi:hypothetical protein
MTTVTKPLYGTATSVACTTTALASSSTLLAGRQSAVVDNTADLALDAILGGTIATTSTPTANTVIEVWLFGSWDNGTTYTSGAGGGDATLSPATDGSKMLMRLVQEIQQTDTTSRTYTLGPISVAEAFGGVMPDHWGFFIVHNTGQTLGATALKYTPVQYQSV